MASENATTASAPSAHVIGNMFVEQYYPILHRTPEEVHKFYQDSSVVSRPDINGEMTSVTTMQAIDEKVMSSDYKSCTVEIKTVDAQHSYQDGVIVLVTGLLFGNDNIGKKFTQSFFLAPQKNSGYFVLNDVFRYVADNHPEQIGHIPSNDNDAATSNAMLTLSREPTDAVPFHDVPEPVTTLPDEDHGNVSDPHDSIENGGHVVEVLDVPVPPSQNIPPPASEITTVVTQEDMPKKSYASIVKVMKGSSSAPPAAGAKAHVVTVSSEKPPAPVAPSPSPEAHIPETHGASESSNPPEAAEGYSIYVRNLPLNATSSQLEAEFKKFGIIKPGGVQVRNHKQHGYCFGFVEFESLSSMQSAIEASPVMIAGHKAVVEEKRTTTRVVAGGSSGASGRGRFPMSRGGYRGDVYRGRGYGGGQGYGRSEFRARGEFSGRGGRGSGGRGSESYQRVGRPSANTTASTA